MLRADGPASHAPARMFADPARFPATYRLMESMDVSTIPVRLAASEVRRARTTVCSAYYKPISKCFLRRSP
jgi:hypothetical protein